MYDCGNAIRPGGSCRKQIRGFDMCTFNDTETYLGHGPVPAGFYLAPGSHRQILIDFKAKAVRGNEELCHCKKKKKIISQDMHNTLAGFQHKEILRNEQKEETASV